MATARSITIRDTSLWVDDSGEKDLQPLLCLHSLWMDHSMFDDLARAAQGRYRVIRPDFRGQGRSGLPDGDKIDMDTCAADIEALIDVLQLEAVNIVAQSMGGDVALRLAARRPETLRSLVILGSSARDEPQSMLDWGHQWLIDAKPTGFTGEHLETLSGIMFGKTTLANPAKAAMVKHWRDKMSALPTTLWPAILGVLERESALPLLKQIPTPTLVISGIEDSPRPPEWSAEIAELMPRAKLVQLEQVGHSVILEAPEATVPMILDFIDKPDV